MSKFQNSPQRLTISLPRTIINPSKITLGDDINLGPGSILKAMTEYSVKSKNSSYQSIEQNFDPIIKIGNRVSSTCGLHITGAKEIIIEDDVMFAANVYVGDMTHTYNNVCIPYKYQGLNHISPVLIKKGCWIGRNSVILGVSIGKFSIIGANSVVTKNIPDKCIAVGSPAKIIKKWSDDTGKWISV